MYAIHVNTNSSGNPLEWIERPDPECGAEEILIDVRAAGINRADLMQREGRYPPPAGASEILGLEVSGTVLEIGTNVVGFNVGDRVCALLSGGGYATRTVANYRHAFIIPHNWSFEFAAAIPEVFLTAYTNLFFEGRLATAETVLIQGGSSGVGTTAIQMAKKRGCTVIVTCGSDEKARRCVEVGADLAVNYKTHDFGVEISKFTADQGVDLVLDITGGMNLLSHLQLLKTRGRLVIISLMLGPHAQIDLVKVLRKRLSIIGSVLRGRTDEEKAQLVQGFKTEWWPLLEAGEIKPIIDSVIPISEIEKVHARMQRGEHFGKMVVVTP